MVQNTGGIDALLQEERSFPPPCRLHGQGQHVGPRHLREGRRRPGGVLGRAGRGT